MKLNLSLAAILAATTFSFSSAISFSEAISSVEVDGYGRYRYDSYKEQGGNSEESHRFTSDADFKAAFGDNFYGVIGFRYDSVDPSGTPAWANTAKYSGADNAENSASYFNTRQFYLGYTALENAVDVKFGRQLVGQFFTDDIVATGLKADFAFGAFGASVYAFDTLEHDLDTGSAGEEYGILFSQPNAEPAKKFTDQNHLYGVSVNGNFELNQASAIDFNAGYALLQDVYGLGFVDLGTELGVSEGVSFNARVQGAKSSMQGEFKDAVWVDAGTGTYNNASPKTDVDGATFLAAQVGVEGFGFDATAGYISFKTEKDKSSMISFEDLGSFIVAGEDLLDYSWFEGENTAWFVAAGYTFENVRFGVQYAKLENKVGNNAVTIKTNDNEISARVDYAFNKKLDFNAYYSHIESKENSDGAKKVKNNHFRFQTIYKF